VKQKKLSATVAEFVELLHERKLARVYPDADIKKILSTFTDTEHTRLIYVVSKEQKLLGVISTGNLARNLLIRLQKNEIDNLRLMHAITAKTAADFIDKPLLTACLSETIEPILQRMISANIKEIPILDNQGHLVGDLTLLDILHICADDILSS
jgi:CBS domain-containing protein